MAEKQTYENAHFLGDLSPAVMNAIRLEVEKAKAAPGWEAGRWERDENGDAK